MRGLPRIRIADAEAGFLSRRNGPTARNYLCWDQVAIGNPTAATVHALLYMCIYIHKSHNTPYPSRNLTRSLAGKVIKW